jgi:hypothetical protein
MIHPALVCRRSKSDKLRNILPWEISVAVARCHGSDVNNERSFWFTVAEPHPRIQSDQFAGVAGIGNVRAT